MADIKSQRDRNKKTIKFIVFNGIIAALYVVLAYIFAPISYGPVQARIAECMTIFPAFSWGTIPGVTLGCLIANLINPENLGPVDIVGGTLATLMAGVLSYILGKKIKWLGLIPPVIVNGIVVGGYLSFLILDEVTPGGILFTMLTVAAGELAVMIVIGAPLIAIIDKTGLGKKLP